MSKSGRSGRNTAFEGPLYSQGPYIAERSPEGMLRVQRRLQTRIDLFAEHPRLGQATSEPRLRCVVVTPYPYLVFYEVKGDGIVIVGVRHGARERGD